MSIYNYILFVIMTQTPESHNPFKSSDLFSNQRISFVNKPMIDCSSQKLQWKRAKSSQCFKRVQPMIG